MDRLVRCGLGLLSALALSFQLPPSAEMPPTLDFEDVPASLPGVSAASLSDTLAYVEGRPTDETRHASERRNTIRLVVAHRDPGVPNWLDTTGHPEGFLTPRWAYSKTPPTDQWPSITAKKVRFDELRAHLHESTRTVTPEERREQIRVRQSHVQQRFRVF